MAMVKNAKAIPLAHIVFAIAVSALIVILICYSRAQRSETFEEDGTADIDIVNNMNELPDRRLKFASALLTYDPRLQKYQDPRSYDFHTCGIATQTWKTKFREFLRGVGDEVLNRVLMNEDMIVLFDQANLVGNVIFIPLEGSYPQQVVDEVMFRKYIKWNPPSNIISAIVPKGYKLRVDFQTDYPRGVIESKFIADGITKTFVVAAPLVNMYVMENKP